MNRTSYSIAILFTLALATYLPSWLTEEESVVDNTDADVWEPLYKAKNLRSAIYNTDGKLTHRIFASEMEHYDQFGFVFFKQPQYSIYTEDQQQPWRLSAAEGTLYDNNRIQLEREVIILSMGEDNFVKTISTEYLEVNLDSKTMSSDQAVLIEGLDYEIQSMGFEGDLNSKQYELKQHVQTVYSPQKKAL